MDWLNYHHLLYFWTVAREGSVTRASEKLSLAQPAVSGQVRLLEGALGEKLLRREGRGIALTEVGRVVYRYADEIFSLGQELIDTLAGRPTGKPLRLAVGLADVLPKLVTYRILEPAIQGEQTTQLVCREGKPDRLLADLAVHALDLVVSDEPPSSNLKVKVFSHLLGESGLTVYGVPALARRYRPKFPESLDGAPLLLSTENTSVRRGLDQWLDERDIRPRVEAEFEDSALLKAFGQAGAGLFAAASAIEDDIKKMYGVHIVGRIPDVRERFYAITAERRMQHPIVERIRDAAREQLFAATG